MSQLLVGVFLIAIAAVVAFYGTQLARDGWTKMQSPTQQQASAPEGLSKDVAELDKRIQKLSDALTQSPSVDTKAQLAILTDEHDRLADKKDKLTKEDRQTLDDQALTLGSLELGRKRAVQKQELEKQQKENADRQAAIVRENAAKAAKEGMELQDREAATRFTPIYQYAITKLYDLLQGVGKESSQQVRSDFPSERPSIEKSSLIKEGKFSGEEQIIQLGQNKEWEFHIAISGRREDNPRMPWMPYFMALKIQAGESYVTVKAPRPMTLPPYLQATLVVGKDAQTSSQSSLEEYQKAIDPVLKAFIQDRYNASPIKSK